MKRLKQGLVIFLFIVFSLSSLPAKTEVELLLDSLAVDAGIHFNELVQKNKALQEVGNTKDQNYIFYYKIGEEYDPDDRSLPAWAFSQEDGGKNIATEGINWLRDDFGAFPLGEEYRQLLSEYNCRYSSIFKGYLEHYVVIFQVAPMFRQNYFNTLVASGLIDPAGKLVAGEFEGDWPFPSENSVLYQSKIDTFKLAFYNSIEFPQGQAGSDKVLTVVNTSYDVTLGKVRVNVELEESISFYTQEWQQIQSTIGGDLGFKAVDEAIDFWIQTAHGTIPEDISCSDFLLTLSSSCAVDFFNNNNLCDVVTAHEELASIVYTCVHFYNYICEVSEKVPYAADFGADPSEWGTYIATLIDNLVSAGLATEDDNLAWMRDQYLALPEADKATSSFQIFYSQFYNTNQPLPATIDAQITGVLALLTQAEENGRIFAVDISGVPFSSIITGKFTYENCWKLFSENCRWLADGAYSTTEKQLIFNKLEEKEKVIWNQIFDAYGNGHPLGVSGPTIARNLQDFAYPLVAAATPDSLVKQIMWELPTNQTPAVYQSVNTVLSCSHNVLEERRVLKYINPSSGKINFKFTIVVRDRVCQVIENDSSNGELLSDSIEIEIPGVGIFDQVEMVRLRDVSYFNDREESANSSSLSGKMLGFYPAALMKDEAVQAQIDVAFTVLSFAGVAGAAARFVNAAGKVQKVISGILLLSEVGGVYINGSSFRSDMIDLFGEGSGGTVANWIESIHFLITLYDIGSGAQYAISRETAAQADACRALFEAAENANVPMNQLRPEAKGIIRKIAEDAKMTNAAKFDTDYRNALKQALRVNKHLDIVEGNDVLLTYFLCAYHRGFKDFNTVWDGFSPAKAQAFANDLNNPIFLQYLTGFTGTDVADKMRGAVKAWDALFGLPSLRIQTDWLEFVEEAVSTHGLKHRQAGLSAKAISSTSSDWVTQNISDFDQLYADATLAKIELDNIIDNITSQVGGMSSSRLKDPVRAREKIDLDPDPDANYSWLTDLAAGRVIYDNLDDFYDALDNVVGNYQVARLNERVVMPLPTGFRDVLTNLRMSNGHIVELQISLKEMIEASDGPGHAWYEEWRTLNGIVQSQQGGVATAAQAAELENLMTQMQNLYNDAYQQILSRQ